MQEANESYLGYFRYVGKSVEDGYMDARKSADVLTGIDEIFRYFLYQIDPAIQESEIEVPVKVRRGSWEALIPSDIQSWVLTAGGVGLTAYFTAAMSEMAKNDVGKLGIKDVFKSIFKSIKWIIRIAKHIGSLSVKQFEGSIEEKDGIIWVGIENEKGKKLFVPKEYIEQYRTCPERLFAKITKVIREDRELEVGLNEAEPLDKDDTEKKVKVSFSEKFIFTKKEEESEFLFPDLKHEEYVELEGHVTRGNENANTIGFEYLRHILTCIPVHGNIKIYKGLLFTNCKIKGYISREDEFGKISERKPKIRFISLEEIPISSPQIGLF